MTWPLGVLFVAACILCQGFFSGSEIALVSANRSKLRAAADGGSRGASLALSLLEADERLLGTCLIGTNISLISGATGMATLFIAHGYPQEWLPTLAFVPFALTFGEAVPKTVYGHYADTLAPVLARPIRAFQVLFTPFLAVVSALSNVLRGVGSDDERAVSRQDLVDLLGEKTGSIDPEDKKLIRRMFAMNQSIAANCMTPLVDVFAVEATATVDEATEIVIGRGHSRLPVYRDRVDNIVGMITHRDLLFCDDRNATIEDLVQPVSYVPEVKPVDKLLREMRSNQTQLAVVVDEYGGTVGLITLEDLLEEIIGEIRDERDKAGPHIRRLGERDWRVPARTEINELSDLIDMPLPKGDYETVGGMILAAIGRIPEAGEEIRIGRFSFHIEVATERAIQTVRFTVGRG